MLRVVAISLVVGLAGLQVVASSRAHGASSPSDAAYRFFKFHLADSADYSKRGIAKRKHLLSRRLYVSFQRYFHAEAEFRATGTTDIYFYNGDPFTSTQDTVVWFALGRTRVRGNCAETDIRFYFEPGLNGAHQDSVVRLTREHVAWTVDDVVDPFGESIQREIAERIRRP